MAVKALRDLRKALALTLGIEPRFKVDIKVYGENGTDVIGSYTLPQFDKSRQDEPIFIDNLK